MARYKLTDEERRALVFAILEDRERVADVASRYSVAPSWAYELLKDARQAPEEKIRQAEAELEFRRRVAELI